MDFAKLLCLGTIAAIALGCAALAQTQDPDESLRLYAVHIDRVPKQSWTGYGIYLGNGLVITAAHVVGRAALFINPRVEIAGKELPATVIKQGSFEGVDLALLGIEQSQLPVSLRLRRMTVCKHPSVPGEEVIVAIPEGISRSRVIAPNRIPRNIAAKYRTAIGDVATTGNSGSGVFDANTQCLLGIVSAKITQTLKRDENGHAVEKTRDVAKYFVPAPVIAEFIPPEYRF
jgi:hypothetical protein